MYEVKKKKKKSMSGLVQKLLQKTKKKIRAIWEVLKFLSEASPIRLKNDLRDMIRYLLFRLLNYILYNMFYISKPV